MTALEKGANYTCAPLRDDPGLLPVIAVKPSRVRPGRAIAALSVLGYPVRAAFPDFFCDFSRLVQPVAKTSSRVPAGVFTAIFLLCLSLLGYAMYLQHVLNLDPCPWCIVQRLFFIIIAALALTAGLHRPAKSGTIAYAGVGVLLAATGATAAAYHLRIQSDPARALECMGGWLERWLDASKLGKMVPPLLQYDGSCVLKPWDFLGLSIPGWSLVWFSVLLVTFIGIIVAARK